MSTVYLITRPAVRRHDGHLPDVSALGAHGTVEVLLPQQVSPSFSTDKALTLLRQGLRAFNPDTDFLAWAGGDTLAAVLVGLLLAERHIATFRWLRYNRGRAADGSRTHAGAYYDAITVNLQRPVFVDPKQHHLFPAMEHR